MKKLFALSVLSLVLSAPAARASMTEAQINNEIQVTRSIVQTEKQAVVADNMKFTTEESQTFWPLYHKFQSDMRTLNDRKVKLVMDYAKNYETMTDPTAQSLMDEQMKIQQDELKIRKDYMKKFGKILPATKVARYFQLENKMAAVIQADLAAEIPLMKSGTMTKTTTEKK